MVDERPSPYGHGNHGFCSSIHRVLKYLAYSSVDFFRQAILKHYFPRRETHGNSRENGNSRETSRDAHEVAWKFIFPLRDTPQTKSFFSFRELTLIAQLCVCAKTVLFYSKIYKLSWKKCTSI